MGMAKSTSYFITVDILHFQGTADAASVGADKESDDFMKLMRALEISSGSKPDADAVPGTSMKHTDKQKVIFLN